MFFNSQAYLVFFLVVFSLYWLLPRQNLRVWLLIAASIIFYASWSAELALLVTSTTLMDWQLARMMDSTRRQWVRRLLLFTSLGVNLGLLCYCKYRNFFLDSLNQIGGGATTFVGAEYARQGDDWKRVGDVFSLDALNSFFASFGYQTDLMLKSLIIPFGISFYTFEAISYTLDVYHRKIKAEQRLSSFMLFILFFPHLVAGPIVRGRDFLPQTHRDKRWSWLRMQFGVQLFLMGLFKKMAIADRMAVFSDPVFAEPEKYSTGCVWLAVLAFAIRIYCDFSGYSDMALGSAHMLGYKLTVNFRMPYLSLNVTEFWRRWHVSLSTWLRDYVYFPLGGSRGGRWFTARNLMITFALSGLWHGAAWTYVIWGVLHGVMQVVNRLFKDFCEARPRLEGALRTWAGCAFRMALTFMCVMLCWVFFQPSLDNALTMIERMFTNAPGTQALPLHNRSLWYTVAFMALCHVLGATGAWKRWSPRLPAPALGFGYAAALTVALVLAPGEGKEFIYFQF